MKQTISTIKINTITTSRNTSIINKSMIRIKSIRKYMKTITTTSVSKIILNMYILITIRINTFTGFRVKSIIDYVITSSITMNINCI